MKVNSIGINLIHEDTFLIDRPVGLGDNLLIIFKSNAVLWEEGEMKKVPANSFALFKKGALQRYGADSGQYVNHYLHFDGEDESFFESTGIWTNRQGKLKNTEEVETIFRMISREHIAESGFRDENENLLLQLLVRKIAENQYEKPDEDINIRHFEELTQLRSELYSTPAKYGSVSELARAVNISLSHFQALYSKYFGISCYEDLLTARINSSKEFLKNSTLSVREIASLCGYESDTCFMRCFKKREGCTPSEYRGLAL